MYSVHIYISYIPLFMSMISNWLAAGAPGVLTYVGIKRERERDRVSIYIVCTYCVHMYIMYIYIYSDV